MKVQTKLKVLAVAALGCFATSGLYAQTAGLQIQQFNFNDQNGEGVAAEFLYGIVVDTTGEGFNQGAYGPSAIENQSFMSLDDGTETGNFFGALGTAQFSSGDELFGYIHNAVIDHDDGRGLGYPATGDSFGIIWFPNLTEGSTVGAGEWYGFYTNDDLTIPSPGATVNYSDFVDPGVKTAEYQIVPEPSTYAAIFGFGVLLFVFLRRRFKK